MARSHDDDHDNNCFFDTPTKTQILDELSFVQDQLTGNNEFDDLVHKIKDVIEKLKGGDFHHLS